MGRRLVLNTYSVKNWIFLLLVLLISACVKNESPIAEAGVDRMIESEEDSRVFLNGEASYDPSGDVISYHWTIEEVPAGSEAELSAHDEMEVYVMLDEPGLYRFGLVVTDGNSSSAKDIVHIRYFPEHLSGTDESHDHGPINVIHPPTEGEPCFACHLEYDEDSHIAVVPGSFCAGCHHEDTWAPVFTVEHVFIAGNCSECHVAPAEHIETAAECDSCHSDVSWLITETDGSTDHDQSGGGILFDHTGIIDNCSTCHDGVLITGAPLQHIQTSDVCESCHTTIDWFVLSNVDHTQVVGECVSCHNNILSFGRPAHHILTTDNCSSCHATESIRPVIMVDHSQVLGPCMDCHNGIIAIGKSTNHLTTSSQCDACHSTVVWNPVIVVDHNETIGTCEACHEAPQDHVDRRVVSACDSCHVDISSGWLNPSQPLPVVENQNL